MKNKKWIWIVGIIIIVVIVVIVVKQVSAKKQNALTYTDVKPIMGNIKLFVSSTGTVQPQNRVEIKPSVAGRLEKVLVKEGDWVKAGQTVALMSSTERAALLDAAHLKGGDAYKYWENVYKPVSLISPISGEVILAKTEPGQSVNMGDVVMALSDHLIIVAQVDETDIGKVKVNQPVEVRLDSYPDSLVNGSISHISYESTVVNNVTVYDVEITLSRIPAFFRSGMSANTNILINSKLNVLTLPLTVIQEGKHGQFVFIKGSDRKPQHSRITVGLKNETTAEIKSGVLITDTVMLMTKKYSLNSKNKQGNPLMMNRRSSTSTRPQSGSSR